MVFATLDDDEKHAFFGLLDEYFTSRPDILGKLTNGNGQDTASRLAPSMNTLAAGFKNIVNAPKPTPPPLLPSRASHSQSQHDASSNSPSPQPVPALGRVAAASRAFSNSNFVVPSPSLASPAPAPAKPSPPVLPRRNNSAVSPSTPPETHPSPPLPPPTPPAPTPRGLPAAGLVTSRKFGDVDTTSAKGMFSSIRGSTASKNAPQRDVTIPPAFQKKKNTFAPPPKRTVSSSNTSASQSQNDEEEGEAHGRGQYEQEEEEEAEVGAGEWAESLYDYMSGEAGDLKLRAHQRVLVTEKTSDDWWTGEVDGKSGLFPASYVKLL